MASDTTLSPAEARDLEIIRSSGGVPAELELLFAKHWRSLPLNDLLANVNDLCDIFGVQRTNMSYIMAKAGSSCRRPSQGMGRTTIRSTGCGSERTRRRMR